MPTKRRPLPRRRKPARALKPVMQDTWPETVLNEPEVRERTSGFVWLALALFVAGLVWALLPSRKAQPLPTLSAPAQRAMVPPARQSAPASAPKPAQVADPDKVLHRADAGAPRRKAVAPALAPTIPAWAKPEPRLAGAPPPPALAKEKTPVAPAPTASGHIVRAWRAEGGIAELAVFGPRNRRVALLHSEAGPAGWVKLSWNGKGDDGGKVPKGLYYLRPSVKSEQIVEELWLE